MFILICFEGLMGGTSYTNSFHHLGMEGEDIEEEGGKKRVAKELMIGSVAAADSLGGWECHLSCRGNEGRFAHSRL